MQSSLLYSTPQERIEAQQLSKQLNSYMQRFENLLGHEKELAQQQYQISSSGKVSSPSVGVVGYAS